MLHNEDARVNDTAEEVLEGGGVNDVTRVRSTITTRLS